MKRTSIESITWITMVIFFLQYPYLTILFTPNLMSPSSDADANKLILIISVSCGCALCSFIAVLLSRRTS